MTVEIEPTKTILQLKGVICARNNVPVDQQRLVFAGRQPADGNVLADCGITRHSTIHFSRRLLSGPC